jgi:hypothetical protein
MAKVAMEKVAKRKPDQPADERRSDDHDRQAESLTEGLAQRDAGVGAYAEEPGAAEVHVARKAAQNVPRHRHQHRLQDRVGRGVVVLVGDRFG